MYVYGLLNPITNKYFYVGVTSDLKSRLNGHMSSTDKNRRKAAVIQDILKNSQRPIIIPLQTVTDEDFIYISKIELHWIHKLLKEGHPLTNQAFSGEGRRPLLSINKKKCITFYFKPSVIEKFGGTEKMKEKLYSWLENYDSGKK
jgi:hypothetical protein